MFPILFRIESLGLELQSYAALVVLAVAGALAWMVVQAKAQGWQDDELQRMLRWNWLLAILAGVIAGWTWQELSLSPHRDWLRVRSVSSWFIALTGLWTIVALAKRRKLDVRWWLDASVRCFFAVWIFERVAAFVAGQDFGVVSDAFWGVSYPLGSEAYIFQSQRLNLPVGGQSLPVIPIQLLEAGFVGLGLLLVWRLSFLSWGQVMGRSAGVLLLWMAATSLVFEPYYAESAFKARSMGSLSPRQLFSIAALVASTWLLARKSDGGSGVSLNPAQGSTTAAENARSDNSASKAKRRKSSRKSKAGHRSKKKRRR